MKIYHCSFAKNVSNSLLRKGGSSAGVFISDHCEFGYILMKQQAFIHYLTWTYLTLCASSLPWAIIPVDLFENCVYDYFECGVKKKKAIENSIKG